MDVDASHLQTYEDGHGDDDALENGFHYSTPPGAKRFAWSDECDEEDGSAPHINDP